MSSIDILYSSVIVVKSTITNDGHDEECNGDQNIEENKYGDNFMNELLPRIYKPKCDRGHKQ